jgi:hypothetical protein
VVPSTVVGDRFRMTQFSAPGLSRTVQLAYRLDLEPSRAVRALREAITQFLSHTALPPGTRALTAHA